MYPRNAASPEPIAIGPVVLIADGTVQTSGCTVRIKPIGVAEGDGAGTTAYSTDGIVLYTPTQAETNYTSFVLIAKKASCIPANITIVTTESATPGRVSLGNVLGTAVTEGAAGRLAGGMVKFFNVASPTGTVNSLPDALAETTGGLAGHTGQAAIMAQATAIQADLPTRITKNTALSAFPFKMVDSTDHITAETGITITATRSLDGAAFAACANSASEIGSGWYKIDLAATDTNANTIILRFTGTGCDDTEFTIVTEPT
jgi:hypothetical protein